MAITITNETINGYTISGYVNVSRKPLTIYKNSLDGNWYVRFKYSVYDSSLKDKPCIYEKDENIQLTDSNDPFGESYAYLKTIYTSGVDA